MAAISVINSEEKLIEALNDTALGGLPTFLSLTGKVIFKTSSSLGFTNFSYLFIIVAY